MKTISFSYSVADVAGQSVNPFINSQPKMFSFMRKVGVLTGMDPMPELVARGLVTVEFRQIPIGSRSKTIQKVLFSRGGVKFINQLSKLYYGL